MTFTQTTLKSLCLPSVFAALRLRDGTFRRINHSPRGPLSSVSLLLTNTTVFSIRLLTIPELIILRDYIFFLIKSNQVLAPIMVENVICMNNNRINEGDNTVQAI